MSQVWYITAGSGGLGLALVKELLKRGERVAATSRDLKKFVQKVGGESENFLPLELKFGENLEANIEANLAAVKKKFTRLDNLVNNAGYGLLGFVEETSLSELRRQFETNVFAPYLIVQKALKIMRPQAVKEGGKAGEIRARIFNLSSIGGFRVSGSSTPYCMSKFAVSALSEGLALDLEPFGVAVINVMPAGFRTEFAGASASLSGGRIECYDERRKAFEEGVRNYNGKQAGDPQRFGEVMYKISRMPKPPFSLFMGDAAFRSAQNKLDSVKADMDATREFAGAAMDFADSAGSAFDKR
ncbi:MULTISPECIES: SDR family NAD(P)-dependent oxidoreductase [Campylobacter]|uniref:SDR family NAD(P)-dependent oxidoreductase n=1 Tax=Campylobacter TaxID=194 RepID=UPI00147053B1|nr:MULTISPECIES: SDR family NAD(P)-dependent oxidoreductase [Campylobacter]MBN7287991.1 SDR family NAD(P)-dependent oxidoreductase [Campylobacter curvus]MDU6827511.1 SDR family NAD(P)-dependent oxidoreductase [Campylobacter sp.]